MNAARAKRFRCRAIFLAAATPRPERTAAISSENVRRRSVPGDRYDVFPLSEVDPAFDAAAPYRAQDLTAPPVAGHVRHDHGAARPIFLNVGGVAFPHRVRTG